MWLYQRPGTKRWWLGYRLNGRQYLRSTKTDDRSEAEKELAKLETLHHANKAGTLTEEFFQLITGQTLQSVSLKKAVESWLAEREGATAAGTLSDYRSIGTAFLEFLKAGDTSPPLSAVTSQDVHAFLANYRRTRSASTVNKVRKILSGFFMGEVKGGRLRANPVLGVKPFKANALEEQSRRPFTLEEMKDIYAKAPSPFWKYAVLAGFYTGLRMGDLICLRWAAVDFAGGFIRTVQQKNGKKVTIPMAAPVREMFLGLHAKARKPKPAAFIWPEEAALYRSRRAHPFSKDFHELVLVPLGLAVAREYKDNAGDGPGRGGRRKSTGTSFHCIRHTFVSMLRLSGGSQAVAKELAGHGSDMVNDVYTHTPEAVLLEAVNKLPTVTK
jgi:integrase